LFIKDIPNGIYKLAKAMQDPCAAIETEPLTNISEGTLLAIADPNSIERFIASSIIRGKYIYRQLLENTQVCLHRAYNVDAEIIALQWVIYYLAKSNKYDQTYTLYRHEVTSKAEPIIDRVEDFYVHVINDEKGSKNVLGVEIGILLRSEKQFFSNQKLVWHNRNYDFTDNYLRVPVVFTIALRNVR
jgi:hypothetical protein